MSYQEVKFSKLFVSLKYLISIFNQKVSDKTFFTCSNGKRKEIIYSFEKHKEGCVENALWKKVLIEVKNKSAMPYVAIGWKAPPFYFWLLSFLDQYFDGGWHTHIHRSESARLFSSLALSWKSFLPLEKTFFSLLPIITNYFSDLNMIVPQWNRIEITL